MNNKTKKPKSATELNNFLSEVLADIKNGDIQYDEAMAIAKVADKINRNVFNQVMNKKLTRTKGGTIPFLSE